MKVDGMNHSGRVRSAMVWSYVLSGGRTVVTLVVTFTLAAMLSPADFGLLAMALVVTALAEMLLQQGLLPAIVQRRELHKAHADTAFWLVAAAGLVLAALTYATAPLWAYASGTPALTQLLQVLSVTVPLQAAAVVPEALIRRALRFRSLAVRGLSAAAIGGAAGVGAALAGWGVWALVVQQAVTVLVGVVVLYAAAGYRPGLHFDRVAARDLYGFSGRSSLASLGYFAGSKADVVLAGLFFGPAAVGLFRLSRRLTDMALEVTSRATQSVTLPALARLQDDPAAFRSAVLRLLRFTSLLSLPLLGFLLAGGELVVAVLGDEWHGTAQAIRGLAVAQVAVALSLLAGPILQAAGRPGLLAYLMWGRSAALAGGLLWVGNLQRDEGVVAQVQSMALVAIAVSWVSSAAALWAVARLCRLGAADYVRAWWPSVVAAGLSVLATALVRALFAAQPPWIALLVAVAATAAVTLGALVGGEPGVRAGLLRRRRAVVERRRAPVAVVDR